MSINRQLIISHFSKHKSYYGLGLLALMIVIATVMLFSEKFNIYLADMISDDFGGFGDVTLEKDFPLASHMPIINQEYTLRYIRPRTIIINPLVDGISDTELINKVENWIEAKGVNPDSHKYLVVKERS